MKTNSIQDILRNKGMEKGVTYILESHNEKIQQQHKILLQLAEQFNSMIDHFNSAVHGFGQYKSNIDAAMKRAGVMVDTEELGENTHRIGEDKE